MRGVLILVVVLAQCALATAQTKPSISPPALELNIGEVKTVTLTCATGLPVAAPGMFLPPGHGVLAVPPKPVGPTSLEVAVRG